MKNLTEKRNEKRRQSTTHRWSLVDDKHRQFCEGCGILRNVTQKDGCFAADVKYESAWFSKKLTTCSSITRDVRDVIGAIGSLILVMFGLSVNK